MVLGTIIFLSKNQKNSISNDLNFKWGRFLFNPHAHNGGSRPWTPFDFWGVVS